jgi:tetratricopeptide (TPR) repeat protein
MSLLLQALQKAAKSREEGEGEPGSASAANELALAPIASEPTLQDEMPPSSPTPAQAATVVQAGRTPGFDAMDYARDHQMIVFLALALLVAIGYGAYVYIQISSPGMFRSSPRPVPAVAPLASSATQAAPAATPATAAKISGMPATTSAAAVAPALSVFEEPVALAQPDPAAKPAQPRRIVRTADTLVKAAVEVPVEASVETVVVRPPSDPSGISVRRQPATVEPVNPTLMQAYEALQRGDFTQARNQYQQVLRIEPRSVDALLGLGAIAWKEGQIDEAAQHYQRVLELEPRNAFAQAGLIAIVGGADRQGSESRLKQLITREPSPFLYFTLGNLYADQGQWPGAQQAYFQAYQQQPDNPDYAFNLAVGLDHLGQTRLALDYYRKALDLSFKKGLANFDQNLVIQRVGQLSARVE